MRARLAAAALMLAAAAWARAPKTLAVCDYWDDPVSLDPQKEFDSESQTVVQQIYDGLARIDSEGRVVPSLAVSWKRVSPTRTRFFLRPGVKFHDGEPFDAEAVRFTIARYLDPATGFQARGYLSSIAAVEVVDPLTVDIVTRYPDGILLNRLAGLALIIPPRYVKERGESALAAHPVGTGPFRFVSWERGRAITLAKNPDYWDPGRPKVDRLILRFLPRQEQLSALKTGKIDISTKLDGTETFQGARSGIRIIKRPSFYVVYGSFNTSRKPFNDPRVRRAVNLAIDRDELVRYDALGNGRIIPTVTMDGEEGHAQDLKPISYDPAQARRLLREAGYPDGLDVRVAINVPGVRTAKIVASQLARAGIRAKMTSLTMGQLTEGRGRAYDMQIGACPDPMAHAFFIQSILLYSKSPFCMSRDADYDARLEGAVAQLDDRSRRKAFEDLDRYVYDQSLLLILYQRIKTYGLRPGVAFTPWVTGMSYFYDADKSL